ncbi:patatin-like phospholipase family protein [Marinobacterium sediminicola]|uniref:patatin-like phospholipase family protein n=1 Tax=Marinobacterium sediminicola TaxID=518898 RepID=UPI001EEFE960|nr:patatin-like phospholipase family protein [Marinobacterium sediminicola]ULG70258.1 patatin-like phospholipase family protein [Marinobacterium sediminicola]
MSADKTVSLVLGSGGARGLAHIGVIHWLEENGYRIQSISGCSMGALIGGIYAAGKLDQYEEWVRSVTRRDIMALLDLTWDKGGLVRGDKLIDTLIDLVGDVHLEDLPIHFTAVATDLHTQKEVWINTGKLFDAIRASIAIPLLFTPFKYKGHVLVDGGVLNPVPIAPAFHDDTDLTLAVNLNAPVSEKAVLDEVPAEAEEASASPIRDRINRFIQRWQQNMVDSRHGDWGAYEVAIQAFDTMQSSIARQKLAVYPPDKVIEVPRNACQLLEFNRAAEMIDLGYRMAEELLGVEQEVR